MSATQDNIKIDNLTKSLLINNLQKEYGIIQNKIDKIADFEFKIKGWCITLTTAILLAIFSEKVVLPYNLCAFAFALFLTFLFHYIEQQQSNNKRALSSRALKVEKALNRLIFNAEKDGHGKRRRDRQALIELKSTPRLGVEMRIGSQQKDLLELKDFKPNRNNILYYFQYLTIISLLLIFFASNSFPCEVP